MTENIILFFLILLCITVIPIGLWVCLTIIRGADEVSRRCDEIGAWAKKELERKELERKMGDDDTGRSD